MFETPFESVQNALAKLGLEIENEYGYSPRQEVYCKVCKISLKDFLDTGFVGCARCYEVFKPYVRDFAIDVHGRANHVGKVPKKEATIAAKKRELEKLIKEKEIAVKSEDYILAEELKTKISRLREELKW